MASAPELRGYHPTISRATGVTNRADLEEIEDTMRHVIFHSTLDWQTRAQLEQGAREAWEVVQIMRDPAQLAAALDVEICPKSPTGHEFPVPKGDEVVRCIHCETEGLF